MVGWKRDTAALQEEDTLQLAAGDGCSPVISYVPDSVCVYLTTKKNCKRGLGASPPSKYQFHTLSRSLQTTCGKEVESMLLF